MYPKLIELLSWNGPTVHVFCFMSARASTKTFVSRIHIRYPDDGPYRVKTRSVVNGCKIKTLHKNGCVRRSVKTPHYVNATGWKTQYLHFYDFTPFRRR